MQTPEIASPTKPTAKPSTRPPFRAILTPNCSLSPTGFLILMMAIGGISFAVGIAFLSMGAWPVTGFLGLDVALIYYAFRANYKAARRYEKVEISPSTLTITRVAPDAPPETFDFNTYWAKVRLDEEPSGRTALHIVSHGRQFRFGTFLSNEDRRSFAHILSTELHARRTQLPA